MPDQDIKTEKREIPVPLNMKQKRFYREYLLDLSVTQAAIRAGYSPQSAHQAGSRLLNDARGQKYLAELEGGEVLDWKIQKEDVVQRYVDFAFGPSIVAIMKKFYDCGKDVGKFLHTLTKDEELMIKEIVEVTNQFGGYSNIKFHDSHRALEVLAKHTGVFRENTVFESGMSLEKLVYAALEKKFEK